MGGAREVPRGGAPTPGSGQPPDLSAALAELRAWAGGPSYTRIAQSVSAARLARGLPPEEARVARSTVYDCFRPGRLRLDADLVLEVVRALGVGPEGLAPWRRALRELARPALTPAPALATVQVEVGAPAPGSTLVGRESELAELAELLPLRSSVLIVGMGGVGKTALADEAARRLLDGGDVDEVLRVNLDGFSADRTPADPAAVLDALVRVGSPGQGPADDPAEAYRSLLAQRRWLLVLDNAADADQVARLLPAPDSPTRALVTSRVSFDPELGLAVLGLGPLAPDAAAAVIAAGADRALSAEEGGQLRGLVAEVGGLPLALELAARRLGAHPDWTVADHVAAHRRRSAALQLDDAVQGSIGLSYTALPADAQRALRLLATAPVLEVPAEALPALLDAPLQSTDRLLSILRAAHLVRVGDSDRVALHDLVRVFAQGRSVEADPPSTVGDAQDRLAARYLTWAMAAVGRTHPHARHSWWWPTGDLPELDDDQAAGWLGRERASLIALAAWAGRQGRDELLVQIAQVIAPYLWEGPDAAATVALQREALAAAERLGLDRARAVGHRLVGQSLIRAGNAEAAEPEIEHARRLSDRLGATPEQVRARNALAILVAGAGRPDEAAAMVQDAVALCGESPQDEFVAGLMLNLGVYQFQAGRPEAAADTFARTAEVAAALGSPMHEQWAHNNLIELLVPLGRTAEASRHAERALELARQRGDEVGEAYVLSNLPLVHAAEGHSELAIETATHALAAARRLEHDELEALTLCTLGDLLAPIDPVRARAAFEDALSVANRIGDEPSAGQARHGLELLG